MSRGDAGAAAVRCLVLGGADNCDTCAVSSADEGSRSGADMGHASCAAARSLVLRQGMRLPGEKPPHGSAGPGQGAAAGVGERAGS